MTAQASSKTFGGSFVEYSIHFKLKPLEKKIWNLFEFAQRVSFSFKIQLKLPIGQLYWSQVNLWGWSKMDNCVWMNLDPDLGMDQRLLKLLQSKISECKLN